MTQLNCLSDNQIKLYPRNLAGYPVDPNSVWLKIHLRAGGKSFSCVNDPQGEETKYCHIEDDALVLDIPSKKLNAGTLEYMIETRQESEYFSDGYKNIFPLSYKSTEILMV